MAKTETIRGVEIFATGVHNADIYTLQDLQQMIDAAPNVGFEAPVKLGHMEDSDTGKLLKKEGMPAFGYVSNLRIKGQKLLADLIDIPKKLATLIKNKAYNRVSAEIYWNFKKGSQIFPRVLKAVALLGAEIPAITDLTSLEELYVKFNMDPFGEEGKDVRAYIFGPDFISGPQLKSKEAVKYRLAEGSLERCGACKFFLGEALPGSVGLCSLVEGEIASDAVCDLFEARDAFFFPGDGDTMTVSATSEITLAKKFVIEKRGDELPDDLRFKESRLKKIQEAKKTLRNS